MAALGELQLTELRSTSGGAFIIRSFGVLRVMVPSSAQATPIDGWSASSSQTTPREVLAAAIGALVLLFGLVGLSIIPTKIDSDDLSPQKLIGTGCPNFWNAIGLGIFVAAMCIIGHGGAVAAAALLRRRLERCSVRAVRRSLDPPSGPSSPPTVFTLLTSLSNSCRRHRHCAAASGSCLSSSPSPRCRELPGTAALSAVGEATARAISKAATSARPTAVPRG